MWNCSDNLLYYTTVEKTSYQSDSVIPNVSKVISVIKKLRHSLPRKSLFTIYKAWLRPLTEYGDIIYDHHLNESFCEILESVEYKAALAITCAMPGTSRDKICCELGLQSFKSRRWYKRLSCMFKIMKKKAWNYFINLIPKCEAAIRTRNINFPTYISSILFSLLL